MSTWVENMEVLLCLEISSRFRKIKSWVQQLRVAAYCRVSTSHKEQHDSLKNSRMVYVGRGVLPSQTRMIIGIFELFHIKYHRKIWRHGARMVPTFRVDIITNTQTPSNGTVIKNEYGMIVLANEASNNITFISSCSIDRFYFLVW